MENRLMIVFGLILFYLCFGLLYLAIGNTLTELGEEYPELEKKDYKINDLKSTLNPFDNDEDNKYEDTNKLLKFVIKGIDGYTDSNLSWINYFFIFMLALLIVAVAILLLHG